MVRRPAFNIAVILLLLSTLFLLQLPQIHTHPSTPVEPSQCPVVLVNANAIGIAPPALSFSVSPIIITSKIPEYFPTPNTTQFLPSALILRAPPGA